jgi:hypothetical protein
MLSCRLVFVEQHSDISFGILHQACNSMLEFDSNAAMPMEDGDILSLD